MQRADIIQNIDSSKFCTDYFIPLGNLRVFNPQVSQPDTLAHLKGVGLKAINDKKVCLLINGAGHGHDNKHYKKSRLTETFDWKLGVSRFTHLINRVRSVVDLAEKYVRTLTSVFSSK
jgi:hypothetical protein